MASIATGIKLATKYAQGTYLKSVTDGGTEEILCILPVIVDKKAKQESKLDFIGRRSFLSVLKSSISSALGWNKRVFVAVKKDSKTMLFLLKIKTAEDSVKHLEALQRSRVEDGKLQVSHLDSDFSTTSGSSMIHLEDAHINALDPLVFEVIPENQDRLLQTCEYILTIAPPDDSATDEEKACYNESMAWLSNSSESLIFRLREHQHELNSN